MGRTGGTTRALIGALLLMSISACAAGPAEQSTDAKSSTATTDTTVDLFATTVPDLAAVIPNEVEKPEPTTVTTTTAPTPTEDESHRSRADGPQPGTGSNDRAARLLR